MRALIAAALALLLAACAGMPAPDLAALPDAPDPAPRSPAPGDAPFSYGEALARWRTPQELAAWIGARFVYDPRRALALSETARAGGRSPPVHAPDAFYADPTGVCVDLAHFAVATLRAVAPPSRARYLLIEFEPVTVAGQTLRRHWIASVEGEGGLYFLADSRRPGHVAGPYPTLQAFLDDYARYRQRRIDGARLLDSHQRQLKQRAPRSVREERTGVV